MNNIYFNSVSAPIFKSTAVSNETSDAPQKAEVKTFDIPKEAADTLKANALFKLPELKTDVVEKSGDSNFVEYIPKDATPQEVRDILADKKSVGRSFFGAKRVIRKAIEKSNNPEQAIENLNYLMNAKDKKLSGMEVGNILFITEEINNNTKNAEALKKKYGFEGGKLDDESFKKISEQRKNDYRLASLFTFMTMHHMNNINLQNQIMNDQIMMQNQMMTNMITQQNLIQTQINNQMMGF